MEIINTQIVPVINIKKLSFIQLASKGWEAIAFNGKYWINKNPEGRFVVTSNLCGHFNSYNNNKYFYTFNEAEQFVQLEHITYMNGILSELEQYLYLSVSVVCKNEID